MAVLLVGAEPTRMDTLRSAFPTDDVMVECEPARVRTCIKHVWPVVVVETDYPDAPDLVALGASAGNVMLLLTRDGPRPANGHGESDMLDELVWVGRSPASAALMTAASRAAKLDSVLLLTGGPGTGKRLLARLIHTHSARHGAPFVEFDQATEAIRGSDSLLECVERAGRGVLYIDRIEARSPDLQQRLIQVLSRKPTARPRIIASSVLDVRNEVKLGRFDQRLYCQFGAQLDVPSLRDRAHDVPLLAEHFLGELNRAQGNGARAFSAESITALRSHDWPGNVRELRSVVERAFSASAAPLIAPTDLPADVTEQRSRTPSSPQLLTITAMERQHIQHVLELTGGRLTRAATLLGIHRNTLRRKLEQYRLTDGVHE